MRVDELILDLLSDSVFYQSFGGESYIDEIEVDDYGFEIGDVTLTGIKGHNLAKLGESIINHLQLNGHHFDFIKTNDIDLQHEFKYIGKW